MAFFLLSIHNDPAIVGVMVEGGTCRSPGPNLRGTEGLEGIGRMSEESSSPGRTNVCVAILLNVKI